MSLTTSLNIAQQALATNAALSSIVSRNIAGQNDPTYSAKTAKIATNSSGAGTYLGVTRATNDALFSNLLSANSDASASQAVADGLNQLEQTVSLTSASTSTTQSTTNDTSVATAIGKLTAALQTYAASPADSSAATSAVSAAKDLANNLNSASTTVQTVREQADASIAASVSTINGLLQQFGVVNAAIAQGTANGTDISDAMDTRDSILKSLSNEIGISTVKQSNGGLAIYTDGGATLFQDTARKVTFTPTATYTAGTVGGAVTVDGVPVTGSSSVMPLRSGTIAGLAQLRDQTTVSYQNQLDQIAGSLIDTFAESDQTGGGAPNLPGLFTAQGVTLPASAQVSALAANISVNPAVDPAQGGTVTLLRDGGIGAGGNPAYTANATGASGYADHLNALIGNLDANQTFDPTTGGAANGTLEAYAGSSVSWLEAARRSATTTASDRSAVVTQTTTSLSNATGVNLDQQLSAMLDLEHSYQASAELIKTVNSMYSALIAAVQ